jgi:hypothetical protein
MVQQVYGQQQAHCLESMLLSAAASVLVQEVAALLLQMQQ